MQLKSERFDNKVKILTPKVNCLIYIFCCFNLCNYLQLYICYMTVKIYIIELFFAFRNN